MLWQITSESSLVNKALFPPPTDVFTSIVELAKSGELSVHVKSSLGRVLLGLAIGGFFGICVGLSTGRIKIVEEIVGPIFHVLRSFPPVAIIPLVIVWFGIGETAKLFSISSTVFFPIWISTHTGASNIPAHYLQASRTLTNSILKKCLKVILPASMPFIIAGIRYAIGVAFIMVFVSELAGSSNGLGYLIYISQYTYRIDNMIAGLLVLGFFGATADYIFVKTTGRMLPWIGRGV